MRIRTSMLALGLCLGAMAASPAVFATPTPAGAAAQKTRTPQQEKFAECAHRSKGIKGAEHKKFMSDCLHGKTTAAHSEKAASPAKVTQREKMKTCNAEAKTKALKGAARKSFMSTCLKG
ncbi:MAG TPA: PsiF family protein [Rhodanobacteraceae bacterium]